MQRYEGERRSDWDREHCPAVASIFIHCPAEWVFSFALINFGPRENTLTSTGTVSDMLEAVRHIFRCADRGINIHLRLRCTGEKFDKVDLVNFFA